MAYMYKINGSSSSFVIEYESGLQQLFSYGSLVAKRDRNGVKVIPYFQHFSKSTSRDIEKFKNYEYSNLPADKKSVYYTYTPEDEKTTL